MPGTHTRRRTTDAGAVAVEAALAMTFILMPLLLGMLQLGDYFWDAQRVDAVTPGVPTGGVAGEFTCGELKDAVAASVVATIEGLDLDLDPVEVDDVAVSVVEVLPDVGATVQIHIELDTRGGLASLIPLPSGGSLVTDFTQRLNDVAVTTAGCH